ncbi:MAG: DUF4038 domain-containing protein [Verrucomicrobiota bacterium]
MSYYSCRVVFLCFLSVCVFTLCRGGGWAADRSADQWEVVEFTIELAPTGANPFDRLPRADISGPGERRFSLPAYYAGDDRYTFRMSFPDAGTWTVSAPDVEQVWKVEVAAASPSTLGPLMIPEDRPQHFSYANGEPCFVIAFEADWLFAIDLETGDLGRTEVLLRDIKANGFNQVVMNVYAHDVNWEKDPDLPERYDFSAPSKWPYGGTHEEPDYDTLNLAFFDHFDRVVGLMNELDLTAHVMIYVWNKNVNWPPADSPADRRYFDYVVARYQAYPNIVWDISKEATGYGHNDMEYIVRRIDDLRELDGHERLVTVHSFSYCAKYPETVDFISYQTWVNGLYQRMLETVERFPNKPIFNIEHGGYEEGPYHVFGGSYEDPVVCLDRNYQCVFAGAYSTHYWQDTSWNVVIWDQKELPAEDRPRYDLYAHMARLFKEYDFSTLKPGRRLATTGFSLTDDEGTILMYLPAGNMRVTTSIKDYYGEEMSVRWYDPLTGEYTPAEARTMVKWLRLESPWRGQPSILIVEAL